MIQVLSERFLLKLVDWNSSSLPPKDTKLKKQPDCILRLRRNKKPSLKHLQLLKHRRKGKLNRALAESLALREAEAARHQAEKETAAAASSSKTNKGIFIQLPGLDDLPQQVETAASNQADRVIGCVESTQ